MTSPSRVMNPAAVVTGAAHGIGRGITLRLLQDGWRVFALDRDSGRLDALARERHGGTGPLHVITADTGSEAEIDAAMARIRATADRLDGLVCNAGIMVRKPLESLSLADWNHVLAVNLTGPFLLARAASPLLRAGGQGAIVTIASTRAHMSEPDTESYSASKGGLLALTHALSVSLGPAIRANCISPGWIDVAGEALRPEDHAQHPAGRVGRVEDVAALAAWLLGPESGFVTGSEFIIDGGMTRKMIYAE
jgi:NAD(P)-dependent dehydrogenase (short-subunit alcohol dehydrogenase family)